MKVSIFENKLADDNRDLAGDLSGQILSYLGQRSLESMVIHFYLEFFFDALKCYCTQR